MKRQLIFLLLLNLVALAQEPNILDTDQVIYESLQEELEKLQEDLQNKTLFEKVNTPINNQIENETEKNLWLDQFFLDYSKEPEKLLDPKNVDHIALRSAHHLSLSQHGWACRILAVSFLAGLIKPELIESAKHDKTIQKIVAHSTARFLQLCFGSEKHAPYTISSSQALCAKLYYDGTKIALKNSYVRLSLRPEDILAGAGEYALMLHLDPSLKSRARLQHAACATTTVLGRLIEQSVKLTDKKTIIGTDKIMILSNRNLACAATKTIGDAVKDLPNQLISPNKLTQNFLLNIASEASYNVTARLLRSIALHILPEALVQTCIPENYEPNNFVQYSIKYAITQGLALTTACILQAISLEKNLAPSLGIGI